MVIRIWRGWTRVDDAAAYRDDMTRVALPAYAGADGVGVDRCGPGLRRE